MSVNSKMTAIADQIRTLQGSEGKLGLDAMATQVGEANSTVAAQASLIAAIQAALEGKGAGGGANGGLSQYATGEIAAPSSAQDTATVTGLAFTPVIVFFTTTSGTVIHSGVASLLVTYYISAGSAKSLTFTPSENGFTLSGQYVRRAGSPLKWYAFA